MDTFLIIILIFLLVLAIYIIVTDVLVNVAYHYAFKKVDWYSSEDYLRNYELYLVDYPARKFKIPIKNYNLQGYMFGELNDKPHEHSASEQNIPKGLLIFSHGLWVDHKEYIAEITYLVEQGWQVLAYDGTGSGESEKSTTIGLVQSSLDLKAVLEYVADDDLLSRMPIATVGHSWGGFAAATNLGKNKLNIVASTPLSAYAYPAEIALEVLEGILGKFAYFFYPAAWATNYARFGANHNINAVDVLKETEIPTLIIHGQNDNFISIDGASVFAHRHEINNTKVNFMRWKEQGRDGHNSLLGKINFTEDIDPEEIAEDFFELARSSESFSFIDTVHEVLIRHKAVDNNKTNYRLLAIIDWFLSRYLPENEEL